MIGFLKDMGFFIALTLLIAFGWTFALILLDGIFRKR